LGECLVYTEKVGSSSLSESTKLVFNEAG